MYLRQLTLKEATQEYLKWLHDPLVKKFLEMRFCPPVSLFGLKKFIKKCEDDPHQILMGIFLKKTDRHIGNIKLGPINKNHQTADLGFLIGDKREWGKGYATQAIKLICDYAFHNLGIKKISAGVYHVNIGSQKALRKAGFAKEGCLRSQWICDQKRVDGILFGKCKNL